MRVTVWGTRGSHAAPGSATARYGGNTSCIELRNAFGDLLILDAGTGIRDLGESLSTAITRIDILLTHLHMDHIQGLGFFGPLHRLGLDVHVWGPQSPTSSLRARLTRYLSPPLFPVLLRDLDCTLTIHDLAPGTFEIPGFTIECDRVCHPSTTLGYRVTADDVTVAYLPDHEPALARATFPSSPDWVSGYDLAADSDLLIHDAQYTDAQYCGRVGWGHSTLDDALAFAHMARVRRFMPFHHDPSHDDETLDKFFEELGPQGFEVIPAREGLTVVISPQTTF